jgi:hypothetical protein
MVSGIISGIVAALVWCLVRATILKSGDRDPSEGKRKRERDARPPCPNDDRVDWLDVFRPEDW